MPPRGRVERTRAPPRRSAASRCPSPNTPRTPACDRATSLPRSNAREPMGDVPSRAFVAPRRRLAPSRVSQRARPFQSSSRRRRARSTRTTSSRGRATTRARRRTEDEPFLRLARCARDDARARSASRSRDVPPMNERTFEPSSRDASRARCGSRWAPFAPSPIARRVDARVASGDARAKATRNRPRSCPRRQPSQHHHREREDSATVTTASRRVLARVARDGRVCSSPRSPLSRR